ncbi:MAG: hypothetical protein AAGA77_08525 [Bacteroidota bacterium]
MRIHFKLRHIKIYALMVIVCMFINSSCSTIHVYQAGDLAGNQPSTEWESKRVNTFFWGALRQDVIVDNCRVGDDRIHMEELKVEKNFGSILATILTIGIWEPSKISWKCAKPCTPGTIPVID